jgi:hypothetical protein
MVLVFISKLLLKEPVATTLRNRARLVWRFLMSISMKLLTHVHEAALRIEKKLDELLKLSTAQLSSTSMPGALPPSAQPLSNPNQGACPLCQGKITYYPMNLIDPALPEAPIQIMVRVCNCKPVSTQLPINEGDLR